jgi:hypothetical protein
MHSWDVYGLGAIFFSFRFEMGSAWLLGSLYGSIWHLFVQIHSTVLYMDPVFRCMFVWIPLKWIYISWKWVCNYTQLYDDGSWSIWEILKNFMTTTADLKLETVPYTNSIKFRVFLILNQHQSGCAWWLRYNMVDKDWDIIWSTKRIC